MSTKTQLTAQVIFDEAFKAPRPPRSEPYRMGCLWQLRFRMLESADYKCPYADGSVESDAFWAGVSEAWNLVTIHKCDLRAKAKREQEARDNREVHAFVKLST